ncbi:neprilysin-4-like [Physella acuta]|uniref:neprilysin-4-like n=1 Tax=Physella acuta TaxID=109671 RepID=UPI0027DBA70C|nr:neprilysin-4-like [Physella acuta]
MIDYKVSPCDNLYQFACGKWLKDSIIPSDQASIGTFYSLLERTQVILKNLLEEPYRPTELPSMKKAKDLFASCVNTDLNSARSDQPLREIIEKEFGSFPIINASWAEESFDLERMILAMQRRYLSVIFSVYVDEDYNNTDINMLMIDQAGLGMTKSYYLRERNSPFIVAYENYLYGMGSLLGFANVSSARRDVADVVDLEIQLAKVSKDSVGQGE